MEFSFDRPNDNFTKKAAEPTPAQPNPASTTPSSSDQIDTSTITNERLRKAIERNRARQAQQAEKQPPRMQAAPVQPPPTQAAPVEHHQASFLGRSEREEIPLPPEESTRVETMRVEPTRAEQRVEPLRVEREPEIVNEKSSLPPRPSGVVSRRSVAKPEDTEFVPVKRATKKVASQISYTTTSTRKKAKPIDPKFTHYLVRGAWVFCAIMVLRLIFANGGVTDYYSQKGQVDVRLHELSEIKKENMQLVREIERMRSDVGFQKKLVRDNLGFIAQDEYLILFPKGN